MAVFGLKPRATQKKRRLRLCRGEGNGAAERQKEWDGARTDKKKGGPKTALLGGRGKPGMT